MSSFFGIRPAKDMGVYGTTKCAIINLAKTLAVELASRNVTVNTVAPGAVETTLLRESNKGVHDPNGPSFDEMRKVFPFGRPRTLDEAANIITWLLSNEARCERSNSSFGRRAGRLTHDILEQ